jgi:7-cyano-7-deazaguanine synthase
MKDTYNVVLAGGGLDSLGVIEKVRDQYEGVDELYFFSYGKNKRTERAVHALANHYGLPVAVKVISHVVPHNYSDALANSGSPDSLGKSYYLPDRNLLFLTLASATLKLEHKGKILIFAGLTRGAPDIYDITFDFVDQYNRLQKLDKQNYFRLIAPYVAVNKAMILYDLVSYYPTAPLHLSYSCFLETEKQCGECPACKRRIEAFKALGREDPAEYAIEIDWEKVK